MAMTNDHRTILQEKRTFLLENLRLDDGIGVLDILFRDKILTSDDVERIMEKETKAGKIRHLLDLLPKCGSLAYVGFVAALLETKQDYIANELCKNEAQKHPKEKERKKLVAVGDGAVGKTCLLKVMSTSIFPLEYIPTVFETYDVDTKVLGQHLHLELFDTAGQENYDRLRPLSYPNTDVVLICFSVVDRESFSSVKEKWFPELITNRLNDVPKILVGTQLDRKTDERTLDRLSREGQNPISDDEIKNLADEIHAVFYCSCSAKTKENVLELVEAAGLAALKQRNSSKNKHCHLL